MGGRLFLAACVRDGGGGDRERAGPRLTAVMDTHSSPDRSLVTITPATSLRICLGAAHSHTTQAAGYPKKDKLPL